jgi:hypothetical protein
MFVSLYGNPPAPDAGVPPRDEFVGANEPAADLRFDDGSNVRVKLGVESIDVQTKYGKLTIPLSEIRRIDFGLHIEPEIQAKIDNNIKRLGSSVMRDRQAGSDALATIGHFALPAMRRAAKSTDLETSRRASELVVRITEFSGIDLGNLRDTDIIHTVDFQIHGKILGESIKATSPHFGETLVKLSALRSLNLRSKANLEVMLEASLHGSTLESWLDTGFHLHSADRLYVEAEGSVDLWPQGPGQYVAAPKGYNTAGKGGQFMAGALVGKIGEQGKAFFIGEKFQGATPEEGKVYLQITPSPWNNASSGGYRVKMNSRAK